MTGEAPALEIAPERRRTGLAVGLSIALHAGLALAAISLARAPARRGETIPIEIVETVREPAPPPVRPAPPPEPPPPPPPAPPPPRKVVRNPVRGPRDAPPPPERALPPPPSAPREDAAPAEEEPPQVGVSEGGGDLAAPAGNTMYGGLPERAPPPERVRPYRAEATGAPALVTALPEILDAAVPAQEYPPQARREGREGVVRLRLVVGVDGRVAEARVVQDPGHGFGEAAVKVAKRYFRFRAALVGDQPVATEIPFTVRFELP